MDVTREQLVDLANIIAGLIKGNFATKFLTRNLVDSIKVIDQGEGNIEIVIPADIYDMGKFFEEGTIVKKGKGSYASRLNDKGSHWGNHKKYVDEAITQGITLWMKKYQINGEVKG